MLWTNANVRIVTVRIFCSNINDGLQTYVRRGDFFLTAGVNYKELAAEFNKQTVNAFTNCTHDDVGRYSYNEDYNLKEVVGMVGVSNF